MLTRTCTVAAFCFAATTSAQACSTSTLASAVPTATQLALGEYSYCGGTLTTKVYIENVCYNKVVTLYYTDANDQSTPLTIISLGYNSSIDGTNYELWGSSTPGVNIDGITHLTNITYQAVDIDETYVEKLSEKVIASGSPPPTSSAPTPYASPTGFAQDITNWLKVVGGTQVPKTKQLMFNNIEVTNAVKGSIVAAQSYANPDYGYNWVRDASLVMDVVATLYAAATNSSQKIIYENLFFRYAMARAHEQTDPNLITGLGEPKFNLDGSAFTGPWGRPQNDGPATAAITLMEFSNSFLNSNGSLARIKENIYSSNLNPDKAPLRKDLLFVAQNWSAPSFDLWEEEESTHFYTRMVQHRAMAMGTAFANRINDPYTARTLTAAANRIAATLPTFYSPQRNLILYELGPVLHGESSFKDIAVILGVIHGYASDGLYNYTNDQLLASAYQISTSFLPVYPIASKHKDAQGRTLGIPIGRYPEDVYNGTGTQTNGGNPWYLTTAAMAEFFYRAATEFTNAGSMTPTNVSMPFWSYFAPSTSLKEGHEYGASTPQFKGMITSLQGWGDAFMRTIKFYTPPNGHLSEEIDNKSGKAVGAIDLTWSYAALLTASFARAEATGNDAFVKNLANIGVHTNSTMGAGAA